MPDPRCTALTPAPRPHPFPIGLCTQPQRIEKDQKLEACNAAARSDRQAEDHNEREDLSNHGHAAVRSGDGCTEQRPSPFTIRQPDKKGIQIKGILLS